MSPRKDPDSDAVRAPIAPFLMPDKPDVAFRESDMPALQNPATHAIATAIRELEAEVKALKPLGPALENVTAHVRHMEISMIPMIRTSRILSGALYSIIIGVVIGLVVGVFNWLLK